MLEQLVLRELQLQRAKKRRHHRERRHAEQRARPRRRRTSATRSRSCRPCSRRAERELLAVPRGQPPGPDDRAAATARRDQPHQISPREFELCLAAQRKRITNSFDYNISHILISIPGSATPDQIETARKRIDEIYSRLEAGEDFARLAVATSQAQTALDGGSLGWRKGAQLPTLFADTVVKMQPGEFSKPIQSAAGFQIVKLNEMRGAERTTVQQTHVRHILLKPDKILDSAAVKQKIIGIRQQILNGGDFATLAHAQSEDPGSATDGGDLGWISPGELVPEFEKVLETLPLHQLSEPIQSRYGWHIVEVLDRREHDTTDEVKREECGRSIRQSKAEEERELWLRKLRDQAYVDIRR